MTRRAPASASRRTYAERLLPQSLGFAVKRPEVWYGFVPQPPIKHGKVRVPAAAEVDRVVNATKAAMRRLQGFMQTSGARGELRSLAKHDHFREQLKRADPRPLVEDL